MCSLNSLPKKMSAAPPLRHASARQASKQRHADLRGEPSHAGIASSSSFTERLSPTAVKRISDVLALAQQTPVLASREEVVRVATKIASAKRELLFSTVSMDRPQYQLVFLRQWLGHLGTRIQHNSMAHSIQHTAYSIQLGTRAHTLRAHIITRACIHTCRRARAQRAARRRE